MGEKAKAGSRNPLTLLKVETKCVPDGRHTFFFFLPFFFLALYPFRLQTPSASTIIVVWCATGKPATERTKLDEVINISLDRRSPASSAVSCMQPKLWELALSRSESWNEDLDRMGATSRPQYSRLISGDDGGLALGFPFPLTVLSYYCCYYYYYASPPPPATVFAFSLAPFSPYGCIHNNLSERKTAKRG